MNQNEQKFELTKAINKIFTEHSIARNAFNQQLKKRGKPQKITVIF
jgi:hypothetical protein